MATKEMICTKAPSKATLAKAFDMLVDLLYHVSAPLRHLQIVPYLGKAEEWKMDRQLDRCSFTVHDGNPLSVQRPIHPGCHPL